MSMLDKLNEIGRAPVGTRFKIIAPLKAWHKGSGLDPKSHRLDPGTVVELLWSNDGKSFCCAVDIGDCLRGYVIDFEWYHCLERVD